MPQAPKRKQRDSDAGAGGEVGNGVAAAAREERHREEIIAACEAALECLVPAPPGAAPQTTATAELAELAASTAAAAEAATAVTAAAEIAAAALLTGSGSSSGGSGTPRRLIIFNLFALEGFHIAEALGLPCLAASPCLVPYAPPPGYERRFQRQHPQLYQRLQEEGGGQHQAEGQQQGLAEAAVEDGAGERLSKLGKGGVAVRR